MVTESLMTLLSPRKVISGATEDIAHHMNANFLVWMSNLSHIGRQKGYQKKTCGITSIPSTLYLGHQ